MAQKVALITGITGQDGSYLADFLLKKGYSVHGIIRRSSSFNTARLDHIFEHPRLVLHYGDLTDSSNIWTIMARCQPREVYNLAAQSHVKVSFELPEYTGNVDGLGTLRLLEALLQFPPENRPKFYQASTSEMYGKVQEIPQSETTPFYPRSPYGVAKLYSYWMVVNYREAYGIHASNGILFNHESPRRGPTFVSRKIARAVALIHAGKQKELVLGNLYAERDWGHAKDYVEAMWLMLQQDCPDDYVVATGTKHTVKEFVEKAFQIIQVELKWQGSGMEEIGINTTNDQIVVRVDSKYFRPTEVDELLGDSTKARHKLNWQPQVSFDELVQDMVTHELNQL